VAGVEVGASGFRVKSGWATAVLVVGSLDAPRVIERSIVALSDPALPETRQPYHAATGREETDQAKVKRRVKIVQRAARRSVGEWLERQKSMGVRVRGAGLVVGSQIEPGAIANPHIRAHAHEGKLFRTVIVDVLEQCGLRCRILIERNAYADAAAILRRSEAELKRAVTAMGTTIGRPWGANEKLAALAAWISLPDCGGAAAASL